MPGHRRRRRRIGVGLLPLVAAACAGLPVHERPWIEVRTRNFEIASLLGESETLELARNLELFRAVVQVATNIDHVDPRVATRIYAFDRPSSFRSFNVGRNVLGYFSPTMRANYVSLQKSSHIDANAVVLHEYVHFLIRNQEAFHYPRWFDEGFAELLSSVQVRGDRIEVGRVPEHRIAALRHGVWVPLRRILEARNLEGWTEQDVGMFYAESWALLHT